jgi:glycosyltransferase involved in cell wall biosynthesis
MRVAFAIENHLGHRALMSNMRTALAGRPDLDPVWIPIDAHGNGILDKTPILKNKHALVLAVSARRALRLAEASGPLDVAFLHTQRMAHLLVGWMRRVPTFLSVDSTPAMLKQYYVDSAEASSRAHPGKPSAYSSLRDAVHRRTYRVARGVVCMSELVRDAVVGTYGVPRERTLVLWPGVDVTRWCPPSERRPGTKVRLLFVGGEFERKGGLELLRWTRETSRTNWELDVVTEAKVEASNGVRFHSGFKPNDPRLIDLVQQADLFVLPTRADMSPWVISEAKAAGKPVLSTSVGALPEMVRHGIDGWLIPPRDHAALQSRLDQILDEAPSLPQFGERARHDAEQRFNAARNSEALLDFMNRFR